MRFLSTLLVLSVAGCTAPDTDITSSSISSANRLSFNRLSLNRLSLNRLSLNRLSFNRLSFNRLELNRVASGGMEETEGGREVLFYTAVCALPAGEWLQIETTTGHSYVYPGVFGLAPGWETGPMTATERGMVSACLLAHVNAYGISVPISVRDAERIGASELEAELFPVLEGAFFGDAFSAEGPAYYACNGEREPLAARLSSSRSLRVCTDDTPDCRVTPVGRCLEVCDSYTPGYGWSGCVGGDGVRYRTTNVYLMAGPGAWRECSGDCEPTAVGGELVVDAEANTGAVAADCRDDAACAIACAGSADCRSSCRGGALCGVDCAAGDRCELACDGSDCEMSCRDAGGCDQVSCTGGAACLIDCAGAADCGFAACEGGATDCGGDIRVCNRPCPGERLPLAPDTDAAPTRDRPAR